MTKNKKRQKELRRLYKKIRDRGFAYGLNYKICKPEKIIPLVDDLLLEYEVDQMNRSQMIKIRAEFYNAFKEGQKSIEENIKIGKIL